MEFLKKHWLTLLVVVTVVIVFGVAINEYLDARVSLLPGVEGTGGER